jgi:hypothetical protein
MTFNDLMDNHRIFIQTPEEKAMDIIILNQSTRELHHRVSSRQNHHLLITMVTSITGFHSNNFLFFTKFILINDKNLLTALNNFHTNNKSRT